MYSKGLFQDILFNQQQWTWVQIDSKTHETQYISHNTK